jgi:hypothetical protein
VSSAAFAETAGEVLAASETQVRVYFARIDPATGKRPSLIRAAGVPGSPKHPVVAGNALGQTILAWTEGMDWNRGGSLAWLVFDKKERPVGVMGQADGVPTWSLAAVFTRPEQAFTIVY